MLVLERMLPTTRCRDHPFELNEQNKIKEVDAPFVEFLPDDFQKLIDKLPTDGNATAEVA